MIRDIPTYKDFEQEGINLLNLAWDLTIKLIDEHDDYTGDSSDIFEDSNFNKDGVFDDAYWVAAQRSLTMSIALIQQSIEFLLKGKISQVSPFLLIVGSPRQWPKGCDKKDVLFSDFKTIDAQDLIRVYNTISEVRLPEVFIDLYENLRKSRNKIMHTVDKSIVVNSMRVITLILDVFDFLVLPQGWIKTRDNYLENSPDFVAAKFMKDRAFYDGSRLYQLGRETFIVIDRLKPPLVKKYFDFDKKLRKYLCPHCQIRLDGMEPKDAIEFFSAQLRPNSPESETIFCFLCNNISKVERHDF